MSAAQKSESLLAAGNVAKNQGTNELNLATAASKSSSSSKAHLQLVLQSSNIAPHQLRPKALRRVTGCYCGGPGGRPGMAPVCVLCSAANRYMGQVATRTLAADQTGRQMGGKS
jgi:hypothetical protein